MRCWITGVRGFVGRHLVNHLLELDPNIEIVGLGRSPCSDPRYRYAAVDLGEGGETPAALAREHPPHVVFHLAAALRDDPVRALFRTNVEGTAVLIEALAATRPRFILGSSGGVYGASAEDPPFSESARCEPRDPYSASKLAQEHVARALCGAAGIELVIARLFNLVGPGQDERHVAGAIARQLAQVIRGRATPKIEVGDLSATRDFIDVRDVARALALIATHTSPPPVVNVASGIEVPAGRVLALLLEHAKLDRRIDIERRGSPALVARHFADISRLTDLGYRPRHELRASLGDVLEYCLRAAA